MNAEFWGPADEVCGFQANCHPERSASRACEARASRGTLRLLLQRTLSAYNLTVSSPSCWLISRETSGFSPSPVFSRTKSFAGGDQSSLKLVASAEIQIWRTGALGEITNRAGGSSNEMCSAPA